MKKNGLLLLTVALFTSFGIAQKVDFIEYDLDNGLHVILHQDNSAPVVVTSVLYHVGAKNEDPEKTGFAHFFEHLLFEGTKNIERGEWDKIVTSNGGRGNAYTTQDQTYYYEVFPSNNLELGLWLESERLMHPVINQIGVDTQKEVVKEERRWRYDNSPYGRIYEQVSLGLFKKHPYRWQTIGSMEHISSATLEDFQHFQKTFYVPNNAALIIVGDIEIETTKKMVQDYFGPIPRGKDIMRNTFIEDPIEQTVFQTFEDPNIQTPLILLGYRTPPQTDRDAYILDMIATYLSRGKSSKLYKKLVDTQKIALQVFSFNYSREEYGAYMVGGLPVGDNSLKNIKTSIDEEIVKIQTELISEKDHQKIINIQENSFVSSNSDVEGIADSLGQYYMLYDDTNLINTEIDIYKSITREEIKAVANKYLKVNQRVELSYLPKQNAN